MTINIQVNHKKHKMFTPVVTFIVVLMVICSTTFLGTLSHKRGMANSEFLVFVACYHALLLLYFATQLVLINAALTSRFQALNSCIECSVEFHAIKFVRSKHLRSDKIVRLFDKLCDGIEIVNETCTFPFIALFPLFLVSEFKSCNFFHCVHFADHDDFLHIRQPLLDSE
jgi:hypothetical protein